METYYAGSEVKDLIKAIIPDSYPEELKNQLLLDLDISFPNNKYYLGSDIIILLKGILDIIWEENDKAIINISEEAVKEAIAPLLGEIKGNSEEINIIKKNTSDIAFKDGFICVVIGVALGALAKTVIDNLGGG